MPRSVNSAALLLFAVVLYVPALSLAQQDDLAALDALLSDIRTLRADVEQLIVESDGGVLEESDIRMQLKKPNGFYWETLTPFPELVVTNGELLWNYQPDLEQVVIENWDSDRSELAAQLLSGQTDNLGEEYSTALAPEVTANISEFILTPRAPDSVYSQIKITFVSDELDMIHLRNKNGEQTVWRFSAVERNTAIADSEFVFEPPSGIEIIENTYVN
jgi:outer membrane lipoprotein carrier protein